MSFITKRERVFDQYELCDLPPRNEGKLKAFASCTDARAWSHFCSDKTEHLVELIKRNNEVQPGKFIPMNVIVDLMVASKNSEIRRMKRKLMHFEQLLAVYNQLELTPEQRHEIETAHAMIKAANKELDEVDLNLDMSTYTDGMDSEDFETGKSRGDMLPMIRSVETSKSGGDEWNSDLESINEITEMVKKEKPGADCFCDVSTSIHDPRIGEMQNAIIVKDAKLNALQNTIAVMENDVCEPYCIYAHINTALEKIFATLRQVDKYKSYLELLSAGKDIRKIDIKGRIIFKLKVLEKFSVALISPCSERIPREKACKCFRAEVSHIEAFALTSSESKKDSLDSKRAHLVADIMQNSEMKDLLGREDGAPEKMEELEFDPNLDSYSIETENLNRLRNLQLNYDELMTCYENLKHERDTLDIRCKQYEELEMECNELREQLREYNTLYHEREHYKRRSEDLDSLKEKFIVLSDETAGLETRLKAESEINLIKSNTIEELRNENVDLEKRLNDAAIAFEREKNALQCKLKETECKVMCQEQQIKSLSNQIDKLFEEGHDHNDPMKSAAVFNKIESLKDQIRMFKDALSNTEEEKQKFQDNYQEQLELINNLKLEIEDLKSTCEKALKRNDYLEQYTEEFRDEVHNLMEENKTLSLEINDKTASVANLINVLNNKSQEVDSLRNEIEKLRKDNEDLFKELVEAQKKYSNNLLTLESEKQQAISSLQLARRESQELIKKVKDYDDLIDKKENLSKSLESQEHDYNHLKEMLLETIEENEKLQMNLDDRDRNDSILRDELQQLKDEHKRALDIISSLQKEKNEHKRSLEMERRESKSLEDRLKEFEDLKEQLGDLQNAHDKLLKDKEQLENELKDKMYEVDDLMNTVNLTKIESDRLLDRVQQSDKLKDEMIKLSTNYHSLLNEKSNLQKDLLDKSQALENLLQQLNKLKDENDELLKQSNRIDDLGQELANSKKAYDELLEEKIILQGDFDHKTQEYNNLYNTLENKIEENRDLLNQFKVLQYYHKDPQNNVEPDFQDDNALTIGAIKRDSEALINKLKHYDDIAYQYEQLRAAYDQLLGEKDQLLEELDKKIKDLSRLKLENNNLNMQSQNLLARNEDLERALVDRLSLISEDQLQYAELKKEIEDMKNEKLSSHQKIKDLLNKLDEMESANENLSEGIVERDEKIAILQNHINQLQYEVRRLNADLAEVINASEEIKDGGYQKLDQSLSLMEAHHSKATHNMKMELAKLQSKNSQLEEKLSRVSEDSIKLNRSNSSKILDLQNEREILISEIRQLEIACTGNSKLSPEQSSMEDILISFDRIKKFIEMKNQQLGKVQTSSQLLLSKADEAKRLVEKEKHEKEEAVAERQDMEKQLLDLKTELEKQRAHDKSVIEDLEAEMLNQKLITDKINSSTQDYISKLEDEMKCMQDLYQNSLLKIKNLNESLAQEKDNENTILNKLKADLEKKSKEVEGLQKELKKIKSKEFRSVRIQSGNSYQSQDEIIQTDKSDDTGLDSSDSDKLKKPKHLLQSFNEVQVLTANVEPMIGFDKNTYLTRKLQQLGPGRLETFSIDSSEAESKPLTTEYTARTLPQNLVDSYSKTSNTLSESTNIADNADGTKATISSDRDMSTFEMSSNMLVDKDLFVIYHDSEEESNDKVLDDKSTWSQGLQPDVTVGAIMTHLNRNELKNKINELKEINPSNQQPDRNAIDKLLKMNRQHIAQPSSKTVRYANDIPRDLENNLVPSVQYGEENEPQVPQENDIDKDKNNLGQPSKENRELPTEGTKKASYKDIRSPNDPPTSPSMRSSVADQTIVEELRRLRSVVNNEHPFRTNDAQKKQEQIPYITEGHYNNDRPRYTDMTPETSQDHKENDTPSIFTTINEYKPADKNKFDIKTTEQPKTPSLKIKDPEDIINDSIQKLKSAHLRHPTEDKLRSENEIDEIKKINEQISTPTATQYPKVDRKKFNNVDDVDTNKSENAPKLSHKYKKLKDQRYLGVGNRDHNQDPENFGKSINNSLDRNVVDKHDLNSDDAERQRVYDKTYNDENDLKISQDVDDIGTGRRSTQRPTKRFLESGKDKSHHRLSRVGADVLIFKNENARDSSPPKPEMGSFGLEYILDTVKQEMEPMRLKPKLEIRRTRSDNIGLRDSGVSESSPGMSADKTLSSFSGSPSKWSDRSPSKSVTEQSVMVNIDPIENYESRIKYLTKAMEAIEMDHKRKIDAIKKQYDIHIKSIINEHNKGVKSIQNLHEETLQDVIKIHENEVENLRTMSIEAMRKAEKLEKENRLLKGKLVESCKCFDDESKSGPVDLKVDVKKRKSRTRGDIRILTKTNVEAFDVRPNNKKPGPCTCSLDVNVSDTIRNIFEQVDVEQRKMAEHAYLKYIASKMQAGNLEGLDGQELSFLHFKVCRTWKSKISKEEALQKKIDTLESELLHKQRYAQQHIADLDRKVAEERRRLQEVREAVCRSSPDDVNLPPNFADVSYSPHHLPGCEKDCGCGCSSKPQLEMAMAERRSAGDLAPGISGAAVRPRRLRAHENNRAVLAKLDAEERKEREKEREKKLLDETPIRLRRAHDRITRKK